GGMNMAAKVTMGLPGTLIQEITTPQAVITIALENGNGVMRQGENENPLPAMQVEGLQKELDRHYISIALKADELDVEFIGLEENGEANVYLPELNANLFINTETGLPSRLIVKEFNPMAGVEVESITSYSNW